MYQVTSYPFFHTEEVFLTPFVSVKKIAIIVEKKLLLSSYSTSNQAFSFAGYRLIVCGCSLDGLAPAHCSRFLLSEMPCGLDGGG